MVAADAIPPLVALLSHQQQSKQEAGLEALAALTRGSVDSAAACLEHSGVVGRAVGFLKHPSSRVRFLACVCLTNLCQQLPSSGQCERYSKQVRGVESAGSAHVLCSAHCLRMPRLHHMPLLIGVCHAALWYRRWRFDSGRA